MRQPWAFCSMGGPNVLNFEWQRYGHVIKFQKIFLNSADWHCFQKLAWHINAFDYLLPFHILSLFWTRETIKKYSDRPRQWTAPTRYVLWTHVICLCSTVVCFFGISHATGFAVLSAYFDGMQLLGFGFCGVLLRLSLSTLLAKGLGIGPWCCTTSCLLL